MKNITRYLRMSIDFTTFVAYFNLIGKRKPAKFAGIFYALAILLAITAVTPVWSVNAPTAYEVKYNGKGQPFFLPIMPKCTSKMAKLILSKESSASEIKRYFNAVLELSKSDNEFPINLDKVWPLVYGRKSDAVETLQRDFIENVDYQVLRQNPQNPLGGRPTNEYHLSISCFEFFIARKVRPVFEVYRQVFHKAAKHELSRKELALMVVQAEEEKERLMIANEQQERTIAKLQPLADFATAAFSSDTLISISQAAKILKLGFGRNTLFKKLREKGVFFANRNEPKQRFVDAKYFNLVEGKPIPRSDGSILIPVTVYCTQKGLAYINHLFGAKRSETQLATIR